MFCNGDVLIVYAVHIDIRMECIHYIELVYYVLCTCVDGKIYIVSTCNFYYLLLSDSGKYELLAVPHQ